MTIIRSSINTDELTDHSTRKIGYKTRYNTRGINSGMKTKNAPTLTIKFE